MLTESIQSAVIPIRKIDNQIEIMLITSTNKKRWIIPKGSIDFGLSPAESAQKEAYEEAGVKGIVTSDQLGEYLIRDNDEIKVVKVYLMDVTEVIEDYPEKKWRERKWFHIDKAIEVIDNVGLKKILIEFKNKNL